MSSTDLFDTRKQEQRLKMVAKQLDELVRIGLNLAWVDHCVCVVLVSWLGLSRDGANNWHTFIFSAVITCHYWNFVSVWVHNLIPVYKNNNLTFLILHIWWWRQHYRPLWTPTYISIKRGQKPRNWQTSTVAPHPHHESFFAISVFISPPHHGSAESQISPSSLQNLVK